MNKEIYIIGGGNSLSGIDLSFLKNRETLAINKSAQFIPNLTYFITMDFTALKKIQSLKNINATKFFIANFTEPYIKEIEGKITDTRSGLIYTLEDFDVIIKSRIVDEFGLRLNKFSHGKNSGFCALQLAIILGYTKIKLLGMDLIAKDITHFHGGYGEGLDSFNRKLEIYYNNFKKALWQINRERPEIEIVSCSEISKLNNIIPYEKIKIG